MPLASRKVEGIAAVEYPVVIDDIAIAGRQFERHPHLGRPNQIGIFPPRRIIALQVIDIQRGHAAKPAGEPYGVVQFLMVLLMLRPVTRKPETS